MEKKLVSLVLCMALLSSLTVNASAEFTSTDSSYLFDIYRQVTGNASFSTINDWIKNINANLGYLYSGFSDTRSNVNPIAYYAKSIYEKMSTPKDYSTVLSNIKTNTDTIASYIKTIEGDTNSISARATEILNELHNTYLRLGTAQIAITNHIDTASSLNHTDITAFADANHTDLTAFADANHTDITAFKDSNHTDIQLIYAWLTSSRSFNYIPISGSSSPFNINLINMFGGMFRGLLMDGYTPAYASGSGDRTLYSRLKQLQLVLASDDDLALKNANKANEAAVKSDFVNGSSSKTSLGASDFGNLKDVGGTFNDLTSLNGQAKVSSFLSGLSSADEVGQGWFSEACRASLDAVSQPASSGTRLVQKTWRGEKSLIYTLEADTSVVGVKSVSVAGSDLDPYNMTGFEQKYSWLWGDAPW